MAHKDRLRLNRLGTVINSTSKKQETALIRALHAVVAELRDKFGVALRWEPQWFLKDIVADLRSAFPDVEFNYHFDRSCIRPDGGMLSLVASDGTEHTILISEKKNQGTNDLRASEGLSKQAKGNAIERLGKNVIGLKTAMLAEGIFPFVCFGDGCDFAPDSSILDRVVTIVMFGRLNETYVTPLGPGGEFLRGSFFFKVEQWTEGQMAPIMTEIAERSIHFYFAKYGEKAFRAQAAV